MSRTSASFTPGPLVATTTPARQRKCRAVSKRGRPTCQANVNDAKAHSRYGFRSHWRGSGVGRQAQSVVRRPAPDVLPSTTKRVCEGLTRSPSGNNPYMRYMRFQVQQTTPVLCDTGSVVFK